MYKNIVLGLIAASAVIIACATLYMASSVASMKADIKDVKAGMTGIRTELKNTDFMTFVERWEDFKLRMEEKYAPIEVKSNGDEKIKFR